MNTKKQQIKSKKNNRNVSKIDGTEMKKRLVICKFIMRIKIIENNFEKMIPKIIPAVQANNPIAIVSNT